MHGGHHAWLHIMLTIVSDARFVRRAHRMQVVVIGMSIGFIVFVTLLHIVGKVSCASTA